MNHTAPLLLKRQGAHGEIATLQFNRPESMNALDLPTAQALLAAVKTIAQGHIDDLAARIAAMQAMQRTLQTLVSCCQGNDRPDCPILDDLATAQGNTTPVHKTLLHK